MNETDDEETAGSRGMDAYAPPAASSSSERASQEQPGKILVVEDDTSIQLGLRMNLEREGHLVTVAGDGALGLRLLRQESWDLLILDLMLPKLNGYEILGLMDAEQIDVPVLVLSARSGEGDKVAGLDLGADDYITKPFSLRELLARIRAMLRRRSAPARSVWRFGDINIDIRTREVFRGDTRIDLTATEFNVIEVLVRAAGDAMTREQIFLAVWGKDHHGTHRTIDNFVAQLRHKLELNASDPRYILTVRGIGYRFAPQGMAAESTESGEP